MDGQLNGHPENFMPLLVVIDLYLFTDVKVTAGAQIHEMDC